MGYVETRITRNISKRGMNYVSELADVKMYNRDRREISEIYFPEAEKEIIRKDIKVETDVKSNSNLHKYITSVVYYDKDNKKGYDKEKDEYAYTLHIYTSKDAIKIKEAYETSTGIKPYELMFFIEDNDGDLSGQTCYMRIGSEVRNNLKNEKHLFSGKLLNHINKKVTFDEDTFLELMNTGKVENKTFKAIEFLFSLNDFDPFSLDIKIMKALGWGFGEIGGFISKAKFKDHHWNPKAKKEDKDGKEDKSHTFSPVFFPFITEALNEVDDSKINETVQNAVKQIRTKFVEEDAKMRSHISGFDLSKVNDVKILIPLPLPFFVSLNDLGVGNEKLKSATEFIEKKYEQFSTVAFKIIEKLESFDFTDLISTGINAINAFLCGVWNGIVEGIAGLFSLVEMIFNALAGMIDLKDNFATQFPIFLEYIDNFIDAITNIDFGAILTNLKVKILNSISGDIQIEPIAYFAGAFVGFVIEMAIEIVGGILLTGGALTVAAVLKELQSIFTGILKLGKTLVVGTAKLGQKLVVNTFKAFTKLLDELIEMFRKGTAYFNKLVDDLFKPIATYALADLKALFGMGKAALQFLDDLAIVIMQNNKPGLELATVGPYRIMQNNKTILEGTEETIRQFSKKVDDIASNTKLSKDKAKKQIQEYVEEVKKSVYSKLLGSSPIFGFKSFEQLKQFGVQIYNAFIKKGYTDVEIFMQGSSVTGRNSRSGDLFDLGRTSDFDIGIVSKKLLKDAENYNFVKSERLFSKPLDANEMKTLGFESLVESLKSQYNRDVNFRIYQNVDELIKRSKSYKIKY